MHDPWIPEVNPEPRPICALRPPWGVWSPPRFTAADTLAPGTAWVDAADCVPDVVNPLKKARTRDRGTLTAEQQEVLIHEAQVRYGVSLADLGVLLGIRRYNLNNWRYRSVRMPQSAVDAITALLGDPDATP